MNKLLPSDIFLWAVQRVPSMALNIDRNNPEQYKAKVPEFDNLYINLSDVVLTLIKQFKSPSLKQLTQSLTVKLSEIFDLVNPKKNIFIAIDGAKPVALFRKEKDLLFKLGDYSGNFISINHLLPQGEGQIAIQKAINDFIKDKFKSYPDRNWNIVFSDSSIPGDASLKINEFIKGLKSQSLYDPNTVHCLVDGSTEGFLNGLVCHELHFYNLNCNAYNTSQNQCIKCQRSGHFYNSCLGKEDTHFQQVEFVSPHYQLYCYQEFRKFLEFEFSYINFSDYNLEKIIDDFILLVILQGHLAVPKLNFLSTLNGGLDSMLYLYKRVIPHLGYLSSNGEPKQVKLGIFFKELGNVEDVIIKNFVRQEEIKKYKNPRASEAFKIFIKDLKEKLTQEYLVDEQEEQQKNYVMEQEGAENKEEKKEQTINSEDAIKEILQKNLTETMAETGKTGEELGVTEIQPISQDQRLNEQNYSLQYDNINENAIVRDQEKYCTIAKIKQSQFETIDQSFGAFEDIQVDFSKYSERFWEGISFNEIYTDPSQNNKPYDRWNETKTAQEKSLKLVGEKDFKSTFYLQKFKVLNTDLNDLLRNVQENFLASVHWSLGYFFQGYLSWTWQYQYNYAPFFGDLSSGYEKMKFTFEKGMPIKTLDYQLIMTHPSQKKNLPEIYQHLHHDSEIMDLWPFQYSSDFNWNFSEEVTIIPSFDIDRLQQVTERYETILSDADYRKNRVGKHLIFTKNKYLIEYENQFRQVMNVQKDGLAGEVIFSKFDDSNNKNENSSVNTYIYLPTQTLAYNGQLHPDSKSEKTLEFDHDQAEILDQVMYKDNSVIRNIERILSSIVDRSEQYNKGIIVDDTTHYQAQVSQQPVKRNNYQQPPKYRGMQQQNRGGYNRGGGYGTQHYGNNYNYGYNKRY